MYYLTMTDIYISFIASEILAKALQENYRAVCAGSMSTVGKNKAQVILGLRDGSGLILTVREFLSPQGRLV